MNLSPLTRVLTALCLLNLAAGCATTHHGDATMTTATTFDPNAQVPAATETLRSYEAALNAADIGAIVAGPPRVVLR